jgi:hypothetical protein
MSSKAVESRPTGRAANRRAPPVYTRERWRGSGETVRRRLFVRRKAMRQRLELIRGHAPERRPVFLTGVQRSGTNMMMETLEWHPATQVFHEEDPRAFRHFQMLSEAIVDRLIAASPADRVVFKALCEAERIRRLLEDRPTAQAVWVFRDWRDVVNSILARWPGERNEIDELARGRDTGSWRSRGVTATSRRLLRSLWRPELDDAAVNVLFWLVRNQLLFEQGLQDEARVTLVNYDDVVTDPQPQLARLCAFLDIPLTARLTQIANPGRIRKKSAPEVPADIAAAADEMLARLATAWRASARGAASPAPSGPRAR